MTGILGAVGLLAWACGGGSGDAGDPGSGKGGSVRNAGAVGSADPSSPPTAMPTVTVTTTATPEPKQADDGGACRKDDLVISMSTSRDAYAGAARPEFKIMVVNTGGSSCVFAKRGFDVRVTSGDDQIWSSAECRRGDPSKETLRRGIPFVETITWNRTRGCKDARPARPGTYVAVLKGHEVKKQIFRLR
ncbi:hypothetical protein ETD83_15865 [Actinomadura soli]|uniref:DUF4232 domain-containing protein n=1 Tax=Actinomadura soli TaxID=2508997 RepID=A0A5C4JCX3_9ACTN|nr:hypothetical protein ETD83_15865 [Actinomadura soli]